ncbi:hypothetical protein BC826DRAFT_1004684, partial [Russula brevipes]
MSSVHSVLQAPDRKTSITLTAISKVLFYLPNQHRERLEQLWVDDLQVVYASAWRKHIFALMIMPISYCPALNKSSILLCTLGLLDNTGAATGAAYLDIRNTSYGFQPTAMVHSLPEVAFMCQWASFVFTIQALLLTPIAIVLVMACYGIWVALHPRERPFRNVSFCR